MPTNLGLGLHVGEKMTSGIAQGLKALDIVIVGSLGAAVLVGGQVGLTLALPPELVGGGRLDVLEAALVGDFALLAVVAGPLAVALKGCQRKIGP